MSDFKPEENKPNFNLTDDINTLPEALNETALPAPQFLEVDTYHSEVANRSQLRRKIFLKWDTTNGFWKNGDDIVACGPNQEDLVATVVKVNYPYQYWNNMQLVCENKDPGLSPQMGTWTEVNGNIVPRACSTCPKNSRSEYFDGGKIAGSCKDAMQLAMTVLIHGDEKLVGFQTANFKVVNDFDDFLDVLKAKKLHLSGTTIKIGRGKAIKVQNKQMFGWNLQIVAKKALSEYAKTLEQ